MENKIGLIGYGGQAKRIEKTLSKIGFSIDIIYKPSAVYNDPLCTSDYKKLSNCNIIFICSPNDQHFKYISDLYDGRYIFCEKTPVSNLDDLDALKIINHEKIFYNFNMRFTSLADMLKKMDNYGEVIGGFICLSHGLAGEEKYVNSWRSNKKMCPKGVFEIITIHVIDLIRIFNKNVYLSSNNLINISKNGDAPDTSNSTLKFANNAEITVLASYFAPYNFEWHIVFEDGIFKANEKKIEILGPRKTFDHNNFFCKPKIIEALDINRNIDYENSILKSIDFFMNHATKNKKFDKYLSDVSLESNLSILK